MTTTMHSECDTKNFSGHFVDTYLEIIFQKEENMEGKMLNEKRKTKTTVLEREYEWNELRSMKVP